MSVGVFFDGTIPRDHLANLLSVFRVIHYADGFKTEFILQKYIYLFFECCQMLHIMYTWKTNLSTALFLFPLKKVLADITDMQICA